MSVQGSPEIKTANDAVQNKASFIQLVPDQSVFLKISGEDTSDIKITRLREQSRV